MTHRIILLIVGAIIASTLYTHEWLALTLTTIVGLWLVCDADAIARLDPDRPDH